MSLKYRPAIVETFMDHYATGLYTLTELCKLCDISQATYNYWLDNHKEFAERLKEADKHKIRNIHTIATKGMIKLLSGVEYDEITEEYEMPPPPRKYDFLDDDDPLNNLIQPAKPEPILKKRFITKKVVLPHANTVMFTIRNLDKINFPDNKEVTLDNKQPIPVAFIPPAGMVVSFPSNTEDADINKPGYDNTGSKAG